MQGDLQRAAPPLPGWYRILSDDRRLLHLIMAQTDPDLPLPQVLDSLAALFGTRVVAGPEGIMKVEDQAGASVAMAAPLPGERERPCELVVAPLEEEQEERWEAMLEVARRLEFTVPLEGATHLHFDGAPFQDSARFAALVDLLDRQGEALKERFGVNPNCRRLGPWPQGLVELTRTPEFSRLPWERACQQLRNLRLSKYCDFNLLNLVGGHPELTTLEVRVLPSHLQAAPIAEACRVMISLLREISA